jgi:hypothetical protein
MSSTIETILSSAKTLESADLFKLLKTLINEAEKQSKQSATAATKSIKKTGSMPKGAIPKQLLKPRAWVEFTLKHALENGWESFTIHQTHKDKESGEKVEEEITMPASTLHDGAHIYEDSVTDKSPSGRQMIHKEAMSLSKQRKETGHPTYAEFEAEYVDDSASDTSSETASVTSSKKSTVVKMTAAEKAVLQEAKKAEKEAEKEAKKAEKEAEKEAKKAEKEAEKEAKRLEKEAEKEAKKQEKAEKTLKTTTKSMVPAAALKKATTTTKPTTTKSVEVEAVAVAPKAATKKPVAVKEDIPNDGMVHPWTYKGKKYFRNFDGETWTVGTDGGCGAWVGVYDIKTDNLDTTVPEPEFADE